MKSLQIKHSLHCSENAFVFAILIFEQKLAVTSPFISGLLPEPLWRECLSCPG